MVHPDRSQPKLRMAIQKAWLCPIPHMHLDTCVFPKHKRGSWGCLLHNPARNSVWDRLLVLSSDIARSGSYFAAFRWVSSKVISSCLSQARGVVTQPQSQQCSRLGRNGLTVSAAVGGTRRSMVGCREWEELALSLCIIKFACLSLSCCYSVGSLRVLWFTEMRVVERGPMFQGQQEKIS